MSLVERDSEISALDGLLGETLTGNGGVAVVTGPVASGKTALLLELAERTVAAGGVFLSATGSRAERTLPLGLVSQLLYGADIPADALDEVQSALDGTLAAVAYEQTGPGETEFQDLGGAVGVSPGTLHRLSKVFFDLAAEGPLVIGVDDAHYADAASLLVLLHLAHRLRTAPIMLVFTQCSRPHAHRTLFQTELMHRLDCVSVQLRVLSEAGVRAVLTERFGESGQFLAADFHRISGGNPLLVRALADDHQSCQTAPGTAPAGEAFGRAVATCLFRCEITMRDAAHALAVLGDDADPQVAADMLGLTAEAAADVLRSLKEAGLLLDGRFRHESVRTAVLRAMAPERPAALHARAAAALRNRHATAGQIGRHLVAAGRSEEAWVLETLRQAAEEALRSDDVVLAVDCLCAALDMCDHCGTSAQIRSALMRAEWRINPAVAARHLPELYEAARVGRLDCRDLTALVTQLLWQGRLEQGAEVLDGIGAQLAKHGVTPGREALTITLMVSQAFPELAARLLPSASRSEPPVPESANSPYLRAAASLSGVLVGDFGQDVVEAAEGVLQGCRLDEDTLSPLIVALTALIYAGHDERALLWCRRLAEEAANRNAPMWTALLGALQSLSHLRRGELNAAEKCARSALALIPVQSWAAAAGLPLSAAVTALTALGRPDEAAELLSVPVPDVAFRTPGGLLYLQARGRHHLAAGRVQAALSDFLRCGELMRKWNLDAWNLVAWRVEAAAATLRLGRDQEARQLLEEQLTLTPLHDHRTRGRALSLLAVTVSDLRERARLLAQALDSLRSGGDWYEQLRAATDLGHTYEQMGDQAAARTEYGRVRLLAELCGLSCNATSGSKQQAKPAAAPPPGSIDSPALTALQAFLQPLPGAPPRLPALPQGAPGGDSAAVTAPNGLPPGMRGHILRKPQPGSAEQLTRAERRVVELAADGHTNRQIASKLFITVSTVEQHLTRAYRKLRVNRRSDLPLHLLPDVAG
ncbi:AAA family ATPase [Streptomyces sp. WI04-05B]|uniref:helix-turn-helix transcriptional regulator n=1 Tax=Streptomyces TaxID=1883 RepID=UPI0029B79762|nr:MULTISPECIES: AAA family ATPase [unclassified Streptomyces]MDX2546501.1 AAA family ATPase [Streptomyces sp. WI04-05B]MDX2587867.1 AAA family ATPase [Streptomyces sp. WI04-05A]MDX3751535.1 AAA family ATPase [Streptomyces sp. AK08-02]